MRATASPPCSRHGLPVFHWASMLSVGSCASHSPYHGGRRQGVVTCPGSSRIVSARIRQSAPRATALSVVHRPARLVCELRATWSSVSRLLCWNKYRGWYSTSVQLAVLLEALFGQLSVTARSSALSPTEHLSSRQDASDTHHLDSAPLRHCCLGRTQREACRHQQPPRGHCGQAGEVGGPPGTQSVQGASGLCSQVPEREHCKSVCLSSFISFPTHRQAAHTYTSQSSPSMAPAFRTSISTSVSPMPGTSQSPATPATRTSSSGGSSPHPIRIPTGRF